MANKFARSKFYDVATVGGVQQLDLLTFKWFRFSDSLKRKQVKKIKIDESMESNLPLICHKEYGNVHLWWIVAIANNILDPLTEIVAGKDLILPSISDIEQFYSDILSKRQQRVEVLIPRILV